MTRILFICMGNICRSPAAEIVFSHLLEKEKLTASTHTDSAGTIGFHKGSPPDPRMSETLEKRGYRIFGKSRQINPEDLKTFDLILVADQENLNDVLALAEKGQPTSHIKILTDYCTKYPEATHIPDPYYGGPKGFETVANLVEDACQGLLKAIQ